MRTSEYAGRLIDLDLSSVSDEAWHDPEDVPLTFSIPFLASDLLIATTPQRHLYRHDLESFYWSFLWIVLEHTGFSLEPWRKGAIESIAYSKESLLLKHHADTKIFSQLSRRFPSYKPITDCLRKLTRLVAKAYELNPDSKTDPTSHLDSSQSGPSLGGSYVGRECISYEAFLSIFP